MTCFNSTRIDGTGRWGECPYCVDGVGFWSELFTGVGSFTRAALPVLAPVVGAVLPAVLSPGAPSAQPASGGRLESPATEIATTQHRDNTAMIVGGIALAALAFVFLSRRSRRRR